MTGPTHKLHDNFRQVPGAFNLAMKNMTLARQMLFPFRVNTTVTQHNLGDLFNIQKVAVEMGASEWDIFMLVPTGRGKITMEITPDQYEETLQSIYKASLTSPIPIKMTCAPQYTRVIAQQQKTFSSLNQAKPHGRRQRMHGRQRFLLYLSHRRSLRMRIPASFSRQYQATKI